MQTNAAHKRLSRQDLLQIAKNAATVEASHIQRMSWSGYSTAARAVGSRGTYRIEKKRSTLEKAISSPV